VRLHHDHVLHPRQDFFANHPVLAQPVGATHSAT
jgi:hypothetical protein